MVARPPSSLSTFVDFVMATGPVWLRDGFMNVLFYSKSFQPVEREPLPSEEDEKGTA